MKINEIIKEGILGSLGKGIMRGMAPGATASLGRRLNRASGEFDYKGNTVKWLGQQWGVKDPETGKFSVATQQIQNELNQLATTEKGKTADITPDLPSRDDELSDIRHSLDNFTQYKFAHPDYEGINIVVRNDGWYLDKLPKELYGQVQRDKTTRLYPVRQPRNIKKFNDYYDQAADRKQVTQEPAFVL